MSAGQKRFVFIDLLRGWSGLVMIEVHVFNAFAVDSLRSVAWFPVLNFVNGLVAPSFLFVAGLVFVIASGSKLEEHRKWGRSFWRQLGRIGFVWGLGYALHLPVFSLRQLARLPEEQLQSFFQVDILQCIALSLLILLVARVLLRSERLFETFLWIMGSVVLLVAPMMWTINASQVFHPFVGAYLNGLRGSLFPVFPWIVFQLAGGITGVRFLRAVRQGKEQSFMRQLAWWGVGCVLLWWLGGSILLMPGSPDVRSQPVFVLARLGLVALFLCLCRWFELRRHTKVSVVLDVSRETLTVYALHLLIIYGTFWNNRSLAGLVGHSLSLGECFLAYVLLAGAMIGVAKGWGRFKQQSRALARNLVFVGGALVAVAFLLL